MAKLNKSTPLPFRRIEVVLSHSRKAYSEVVFRQTTENLIRCLENAFWHFGGVPKTLVPDNLKAAVLKADWYDPDLNPKLRSFCEHYGTVLLPTKPRTPRHKGKVERGATCATFFSACTRTTYAWRRCCPIAGPRRIPRRFSIIGWKSHEPKRFAPALDVPIAAPVANDPTPHRPPPWTKRSLSTERNTKNAASHGTCCNICPRCGKCGPQAWPRRSDRMGAPVGI